MNSSTMFVAVCFLYGAVGLATYKTLHWWRGDYYNDEGSIAFLTGLFWPMALPMYLINALAEYTIDTLPAWLAKKSAIDQVRRTRRR